MNMAAISEREGFAAFLLRMRARNMRNNELFAALENTPRSHFVPSEWHSLCWSNGTIPIECGESLEGLDLQATVLDALELGTSQRVFEIGTGSGFTSAVLSKLAGRVISVDRYRTLVEEASLRHQNIGIKNVLIRQADGLEGVDDGPYDRIVVWAAFEEPPRRFVEYLTSGGIMLAPVGPAEDVQMMYKFVKTGSRFERTEILPVRLQPLTAGIALAL